jgi:hypothetical protein
MAPCSCNPPPAPTRNAAVPLPTPVAVTLHPLTRSIPPASTTTPYAADPRSPTTESFCAFSIHARQLFAVDDVTTPAPIRRLIPPLCGLTLRAARHNMTCEFICWIAGGKRSGRRLTIEGNATARIARVEATPETVWHWPSCVDVMQLVALNDDIADTLSDHDSSLPHHVCPCADDSRPDASKGCQRVLRVVA